MYKILNHSKYQLSFSYFNRSDFENVQKVGEYQEMCKWLGFVCQFAFLHAFFWMNVMCYDIFRKFTKMRAPNQGYATKVGIKIYQITYFFWKQKNLFGLRQ